MRILIIGKNGNLGRELLKTIDTESVTGLDRGEIDVTKSLEVSEKLKALKPDVVFNCAAYTAVDKAEEDYDAAELLNGHAPEFLAKSCNEIDAILVHYSTGMIFSGYDSNGYNEDSEPNPVNAYGETKLLGEELIKKNHDKHYIIRTEWLYAKPENDTAKKSFNEIMIGLAETQDKLVGVEDEIGKPTWAKDLAEESWRIVQAKLPFGIYHITNSGQASRLEWTKEILRLKGINKSVDGVKGETFPRPAKRPHYELINNTKLPPLRSWQEALKEYLENS